MGVGRSLAEARLCLTKGLVRQGLRPLLNELLKVPHTLDRGVKLVGAPKNVPNQREEVWGGMPTYEYRCAECGEVFELERPVSERDSEATCPKCGSKRTSRMLSRGIILIGLESQKGSSSACTTCTTGTCSTCSLSSED